MGRLVLPHGADVVAADRVGRKPKELREVHTWDAARWRGRTNLT
jgi:hypothetical protein